MFLGAGAVWNYSTQHTKHTFYTCALGEGADIGKFYIRLFSSGIFFSKRKQRSIERLVSEKNSREIFFSEGDKIIIFVVSHYNVIAWAVPLYQESFGDKRFDFRFRFAPGNIGSFLEHFNFGRSVEGRFSKIRTQALAQVYCFAHIQNFSLWPFKKIDARMRRDFFPLFLHFYRHNV